MEVFFHNIYVYQVTTMYTWTVLDFCFLFPDCCRFNSGPQRYVQVVTPRTCKDDIVNNLGGVVMWAGDEINPDLGEPLFVCFFDAQSCWLFVILWTVAQIGFSVLRIFQGKILEWTALSYSMDCILHYIQLYLNKAWGKCYRGKV